MLREFAIVVPGSITVNAVPDDPDDNIFIPCALDAVVDVIVSGDRHLLRLGSYQGIPIDKASDFLSKMHSATEFVQSNSLRPLHSLLTEDLQML